MLEKLIEELNAYRQAPERWQELKWAGIETEDDYDDENQPKRTRMLVAMQFDRREEDLDFIKYLFGEEIKDRENDPYQGGSKTLNRAGFLLAAYRRVDHLPYFLDAKTANFDTHCGFDWEHLLSAGVAATFAHLPALSLDQQTTFQNYFESESECELTEENIENWFAWKSKGFPAQHPKTDLEFWIETAFEVDERAEAQVLVEEFEKQTAPDQSQLESLQYHYQRLGNIPKQIEILEELLKRMEGDELRASKYIQIAQLQLKDGFLDQAWEAINTIFEANRLVDKWGIADRASQISEVCLDIVNQASSHAPYLQEAYDFAVHNPGNWQAFPLLKKYELAAQKMGDEATAKHYGDRYQAEKARLDEIGF